MTINEKILKWLLTGRVGESSRAMACCITGYGTACMTPSDPSDFNRCLMFLDAVPDARACMDKFRKISPMWAVIVDHWDEIEKCFLDEVGLDWCKGGCALKTYALMNRIIDEARLN